MRMKYSVITFGCRVNQADSLGFEEELRAAGAVAAAPDQADLIVVNTCSVTSTSDQGARQTIRRVARENPNARIVVTGCYATRRPDEVAALPNVAHVMLNDDKPQLLSIVRGVRLSCDKGRLVADLVRGKKVGQAIDILNFTQKKAAGIIKKALESAIANAEHNDGADIDELKVKTIFVEQGMPQKRFQARAKGRGNRIVKRTCHIFVIVGDEEKKKASAKKAAAKKAPAKQSKK